MAHIAPTTRSHSTAAATSRLCQSLRRCTRRRKTSHAGRYLCSPRSRHLLPAPQLRPLAAACLAPQAGASARRSPCCRLRAQLLRREFSFPLPGPPLNRLPAHQRCGFCVCRAAWAPQHLLPHPQRCVPALLRPMRAHRRLHRVPQQPRSRWHRLRVAAVAALRAGLLCVLPCALPCVPPWPAIANLSAAAEAKMAPTVKHSGSRQEVTHGTPVQNCAKRQQSAKE